MKVNWNQRSIGRSSYPRQRTGWEGPSLQVPSLAPWLLHVSQAKVGDLHALGLYQPLPPCDGCLKKGKWGSSTIEFWVSYYQNNANLRCIPFLTVTLECSIYGISERTFGSLWGRCWQIILCAKHDHLGLATQLVFSEVLHGHVWKQYLFEAESF